MELGCCWYINLDDCSVLLLQTSTLIGVVLVDRSTTWAEQAVEAEAAAEDWPALFVSALTMVVVVKDEHCVWLLRSRMITLLAGFDPPLAQLFTQWCCPFTVTRSLQSHLTPAGFEPMTVTMELERLTLTKGPASDSDST